MLTRTTFAITLILFALVAVACSGAPETERNSQPPSDEGNNGTTPALKPITRPVEPEPTESVPDATEALGELVEDQFAEGEAVVSGVGVNILESFPVQATAVVRGDLADGCTRISRWEQSGTGSNIIFIRLYTSRPLGVMCSQALVPFEERIPLELVGLPAGEYVLDVNGFKTSFNLALDNASDDVAGRCPRGEEGTILYTDESTGFCLLFPAEFTIRDDEAPGVVSFYGPALDGSIEPMRAILTVNYSEQFPEKSLKEISSDRLGEYEGLDAIIAPTTLDGQEAIIIQGLGEPARGIQILAQLGDRLLEMSASPFDEEFPQGASDAERAWNLALDSFRFIP